MAQYEIGTVIETKKKHPCGSALWTIVRTGADYKIKCNGCGRIIMLEYEELNKKIKKVVKND